MGTRAVVVGASMAGLLAARALADHADEVTVFERDTLADDGNARRGVPQGRHAHAILAAGEGRIEGWFPGIVDELVAQGAVRGDGGNARWYQCGAFKVQAPVGIMATCASRPLLEQTVRRRLIGLANVEVRSGASVERLHIVDGRVGGIVADGEVVPADLVVDCSGRNTRLLADLAAAGFPEPDTSSVQIGMCYATRLLRRRPTDLDADYCIIAPTPPQEPRFGVLLPIEGDRWILTIGGFHDDAPPTDDEGYLAFARSLPSPVLAELLERTEVLSPVMTHRLASNQRRHFEKLRRLPVGYLALGDAVCSFNPIYGQGMSSAALQAEQLQRQVARHGLRGAKLPAAFYRQAAKVVNNPWQIAAGSDFLHPATTGPKPPGTDFINRYVAKVQAATHTSEAVLAQMQKVQNLLAPPPSLMAPAMMVRVLRAARRSPARGVAPSVPPRRQSPIASVPVDERVA